MDEAQASFRSNVSIAYCRYIFFENDWSATHSLILSAEGLYPCAAYKAMSPAMKGREIPARPARAIGIFSSSDILSVFLQMENGHICETAVRKSVSSQTYHYENGRNLSHSRCEKLLRFGFACKSLSFLFPIENSHQRSSAGGACLRWNLTGRGKCQRLRCKEGNCDNKQCGKETNRWHDDVVVIGL